VLASSLIVTWYVSHITILYGSLIEIPPQLFASNVVLPMLGYVYWTNDTHPDHETAINSATLAGCIVGQIAFGIFADAWGRRKMYGIELILLAAGTLGFLTSSTGYDNSMNVVSWMIFWRFLSGVGIGADYPLSSVITSEYDIRVLPSCRPQRGTS
jgi:PHS family inorganic phosphate transporter-like MFS transporter